MIFAVHLMFLQGIILSYYFYILRIVRYLSFFLIVHVGEYGVHWNFFFTLAAMSILTSIINVPPNQCGILDSFILIDTNFIERSIQSRILLEFHISVRSNRRFFVTVAAGNKAIEVE